MGRTACTEPQYLYKDDLYLYLCMTVTSYVSVMLQKAYHSVFKIVKNYVKGPFGVDCLVFLNTRAFS